MNYEGISEELAWVGERLQHLFASKYKTILPTEKELMSFIERENQGGR